MSLQTKIRENMVAAMKSRDTEVVSLLRVVAGEFSRVKDENGNFVKEVSDEQALTVMKKMSENAKEMKNLNEVLILDKYLPTMLTEAQIRVAVNSIITEMGYSTMKDIGAVMSEIKKLGTAPQIDGKISSKIVKEILSQ